MKFYRILTILFILFCSLNSTLSQSLNQPPQGANPIIVSPRVGAVIDSVDILYYELFYFLRDIQSATAYPIDTSTIGFYLKRYLQSDTVIMFKSNIISNYLPIYIENFESIYELSTISKIPTSEMNLIGRIHDKDFGKNERASKTIVKRDNSVLSGEILIVTDEGVFITKRTGTYNWKTIQSDIQFINYNDIDEIKGTRTRYYKGNIQLLKEFFSDEYIGNRLGTFTTFSHKPIPKELRQIISDSSRASSQSDSYTLEQLRMLKPTSGRFVLSIGTGAFSPTFVQVGSSNESNQSPDLKNKFANPNFAPLEFQVEYVFLHSDWQNLSAQVSAFYNLGELNSNTILDGWNLGLSSRIFLVSVDNLNTRGIEFSLTGGLSYCQANYSAIHKRTQGLHDTDTPRDADFPVNLNISMFQGKIGILNRYQFTDFLSVQFHAIVMGQLQNKADMVSDKWGRYGRNYYISVGVYAPDLIFDLGVKLQYNL